MRRRGRGEEGKRQETEGERSEEEEGHSRAMW